MHAPSIVMALEVIQLAAEVMRIPEGHEIEELSPDRADESLHERMREGDIRHGLDLCQPRTRRLAFQR